jgi:hypothetical protein
MKPHQEITFALDYTDVYQGKYYDYYQIHIFSFNQIFSTYIHPDTISTEQLKQNTQNTIAEIAKRSKTQPALFERNGKFLITYHKDILDPVEQFQFIPEFVRYEANYDYNELFDFIGDTKIEDFIKNALTTVGAEELYNEIELQVNNLIKIQENNDKYNNKIRDLDKTDPKYLIEIYKIEKNYIPVKEREILSNDFESTIFLPENRDIRKQENRYSYKAIEIATNKVVENTTGDTIESIKHDKYLRKNPPLIDSEALQRMELDNDDPDFLSYEDYLANDDEYEDGDDEYSPGHTNKP